MKLEALELQLSTGRGETSGSHVSVPRELEPQLLEALNGLAQKNKFPKLGFVPFVLGLLAPMYLVGPLTAPVDDILTRGWAWAYYAQLLLGLIALSIWARRRVDTPALRDYLKRLTLGETQLELPKRGPEPLSQTYEERLLTCARHAESIASKQKMHWQFPVALFIVSIANTMALTLFTKAIPNALTSSASPMMSNMLIASVIMSLILWPFCEVAYSWLQFVDHSRVFFLRLLQLIPDAQKSVLLLEKQAQLAAECSRNLILDALSPGNRLAFAGGAFLGLLGLTPMILAHYL